MLNTEDFIKRLEYIMEHFGLNASSFADKVSVQRSSISHLLSGRNKPSLDFILKILDVFPELNLYWLLDGSGTYLKNISEEHTLPKVEIPPAPIVEKFFKTGDSVISEQNKTDVTSEQNPSPMPLLSQNSFGKQVEKIVLLYTDGTFLVYSPGPSK